MVKTIKFFPGSVLSLNLYNGLAQWFHFQYCSWMDVEKNLSNQVTEKSLTYKSAQPAPESVRLICRWNLQPACTVVLPNLQDSTLSLCHGIWAHHPPVTMGPFIIHFKLPIVRNVSEQALFFPVIHTAVFTTTFFFNCQITCHHTN